MSNKRVNPFKLKLHLLECEADEKDKKISDLEARLAESEADKKALISDYESRITKHQELMSWLEHDNGQLKQQLHDLPKKIVEEIKIEMGGIEDILINCGNGKEDALSWFNRILQTILKKYGGKSE